MGKKNSKFVIAAGGTGGHLFPAQATAKALLKKNPNCEISFLAKGLSQNPHFKKKEFNYHDIQSASFAKNPLKMVKNIFLLLQGILQSVNMLSKKKPELVVGFGSYHTFPVLFAACMLRIPVVLHESNSVPGLVNRLFSRYARWIGIFFPKASQSLKGTTRLTSVPLRHELCEALPSKEEALRYYGLHSGVQTVLIFGGSQGAKALNILIQEACVEARKKVEFQVIHFTGNHPLDREVYSNHGICAHVKPFESCMQYAWRAADLVIARSGASTIAEQLAFQVPALFVPYPHATDNHQLHNARFVQECVKGACYVEEKAIEKEQMARMIADLLLHKTQQEMKDRIREYISQGHHRDFCDEVFHFSSEEV